ncbi:hypothetical protein GCM10023075_70940 [Streptosporangium album]
MGARSREIDGDEAPGMTAIDQDPMLQPGASQCWKILTKLRCCPRRVTAIMQAILVLHQARQLSSGSA